MPTPDLSSITPSPTALKALAHPVRLRILGLLRADGPATSTTLATRLGMNSGATSYHLRQLAEHGFVEDDHDRGTARERWWRAKHASTRVSDESGGDPQTRAAYMQSVAVVYTERLQHAVEEITLLPASWGHASTMSDWQFTVTPERARELLEAVVAVIEGWPEDPPGDPGVGQYLLQLNAFPRPGTVVSGPTAEPGEEQ